MNVPLIKTNNLKKYFNTKNGLLHAVDDVNINISEGENSWSGWRVRLRKIYLREGHS